MKDKRILILGGTGALGKTLTKRYHNDNDIMIFSRDEHKQVNMKKDYTDVSYQIGDVKDKDSICQVIKTNIIGHKNLIDCASNCNHKIETLMFISTDKACKPINVYGMSKAISERLYIDYANKQSDIKVVLCRYGNVLESTGSVIPFFKELLDKGFNSLPITDKRMTRFLISLEESVDLIDWAFNHDESHGCIIVPKLKSLLVTDLAVELGHSYAGLDDVKLNYVGIRPGEKIHEEMVSLEESLRAKEYDKYFMITDDIINENAWSFASDSDVMSFDDVNGFLKEKGVID